MKLRTFKQAESYLNKFISSGHKFIFEGSSGLDRVKKFYKALGDPQEKLKIIHVAGTSGKGSTCYLIASLLASQGFKVGLTQSPHLTHVCERFQINNQNISKKEFVFYLNKIIPVVDRFDVSYFEILIGLAFYIFAEKKVDYAVIETGLGGLYDSTNTVFRSDKLSVITKIGLDHTNVLGKTIAEIAYQKAGIINKNSQVISTKQDPEAEEIIKKVAEERQAGIIFAGMKSDAIGYNRMQSVLNKLNLLGQYQKENAALALTAVEYLSKRDGFILNQNKIKNALQTAHFPGRFDVKTISGKTIIFDGAHNPQKMEAFIGALKTKYPNKKFDFLLAFKKGKDYQEMLKIILGPPSPRLRWVNKIIFTSFYTGNQDMVNESVDPVVVGNGLEPFRTKSRGQVSRPSEIKIIPNLKTAWENILESEGPIVVTGSLYLIGEVFRLIK